MLSRDADICGKTITKRKRLINAKFRLVVTLDGKKAEWSWRGGTGDF